MPPRRARLRQPLSWKRGGAVALAVLGLIIAAALMLDAGAAPEVEAVQERLAAEGRPPVEVVEAAGRVSQVVLLADVPGHPGPKRLAAEAIRALSAGPGLDAVVLEVPSTEQATIDTYLSRADEDATLLVARPGVVREDRAYLDIYRAVWQVNQELGPARRIRIIAADDPGWPPPEGASPQEVAARYARRSAHMLGRMHEELLALMPEARVLVFVDGYLTLQRTRGQLAFAGGAAQEVEWLGELLRARRPAATRTVLVDAPSSPTAVRRLPEYHGTALHRPLRRQVRRSAGMRIDDAFSEVRSPILEASAPGLRLEILPRRYVLRDVADSYIFLR
jgi:hypothetical protein